jgi:hypothetical protein
MASKNILNNANQVNEESKDLSEIGSDYFYPSCDDGVHLSLNVIIAKAYKIFDALKINPALRNDRSALSVFLLI